MSEDERRLISALVVRNGDEIVELYSTHGGTLIDSRSSVRVVEGFVDGPETLVRLRHTLGDWYVVPLSRSAGLRLDGRPIDGSRALEHRHILEIADRQITLDAQRRAPVSDPSWERHEPLPMGEPHRATRYLCAAAYVDDRYARSVVEQVVYPFHRAMAPSHGFEPAPVVAHCVRALRRSAVRSLVILVIVLTSLIVGTVSSLENEAPGSSGNGTGFSYAWSVVVTISLLYGVVTAVFQARYRRLFVLLGVLIPLTVVSSISDSGEGNGFWFTLIDVVVGTWDAAVGRFAGSWQVCANDGGPPGCFGYGVPADRSATFPWEVAVPLSLLIGTAFVIEVSNSHLLAKSFGPWLIPRSLHRYPNASSHACVPSKRPQQVRSASTLKARTRRS